MNKMNVAIVGGGRGGTGLLELFLGNPGLQVQCIIDSDPGASGIQLAKAHSIQSYHHIDSLKDQAGIDLVINVTGDNSIHEDLVEIMDDPEKVINTQISSVIYRLLIESNRLKEEVEKTRSHLQSIIDTSRDMIITTDQEGKVTTFNRGAESMLGYSMQEIAGKPMIEFYSNTRERAYAMDVVIREGFISNYETTLKKKSGEDVDISLTLSALYDENGAFAGTVGVSKDITARKKNERIIQEKNKQLEELTSNLERIVAERTKELEAANARLTEINQYKSQFIANMSHELRTPLNSIIGFSEILVDGGFGELNEKQKRYAGNINKSGHHLLQIINDILDLSKIDAGKMELNMSHFDVNELIQSSIFIFDSTAMKKGIQLRTELDEVSRVVYADQGRIKQVLYNLIGNAVKFTRQGGTVFVRTKKTDGGMQIEVEDSGIGISQNDQSRIFNEFEQADNSYSREFEGTGLGLPLVKKFLNMHGSEIYVKSTPDVGSTFWFALPFHEDGIHAEQDFVPSDVQIEEAEVAVNGSSRSSKQNLEKEPMETEKNQPNRGHVLIIEDDPGSLELIALTLSEKGYRTSHVRSGEKALEKAKEAKPDLITLDIMLPNMDGYEIIQALKNDPLTAHIPVIIITMTENKKLAFSLGAVDFLNKPIDRNEFVQTVEGIFEDHFKNKETIDIIAVDDVDDNLRLIQEILNKLGEEYRLNLRLAHGGMEALHMMEQKKPDLLVLDLMMPEVNGFEVIQTLQSKYPEKKIPVLVLTAMNLEPEEKSFLEKSTEKVILKSELRIDEFLQEVKNIISDQSLSN